ncbi:MAG: hypothetical protein HW416_1985 [Chloroflexi bacterium]|nr:hypothetical protein [Chloroflexota bacterium]
MSEDQRPGTVYWVDHQVVGTNDLTSWVEWAVNVIGVKPGPIGGLTTDSFKKKRPPACFAWLREPCHIGAFLQVEQFPSSDGLGKELPRYGFFIRQTDIDEHLRRLDLNKVEHSDPIRTSEYGESGTTIYLEDPDQNQWEFWAPDKMADGAMDGCGPLKVGHICGPVFGARDLERNADFFNTYCGLDPARSADIPNDTLVLPLAAGGRLVYKRVEQADKRTLGHKPWNPPHTALVVRDEDFFPSYRRMYDGLPEWEGHDPLNTEHTDDEDNLPARTGLHGSPDGRRWKATYGRGDEFYDFETHAFHFVGGIPKKNGTMALYDGRYMEDYLEEYAKGNAAALAK